MTNFSSVLWNQNQNIINAIFEHPFNQQLANGTLPLNKFCYYIEQDAIYLFSFARALAIIASRMSDPKLFIVFLKFSEGAIVAEQEIVHQHFLKKFAWQKTNEQTLACFTYNNFLINQALNAPIEVAVSAVVPCFWIYYEIGKHIHARNNSSQNPYSKWIETYASTEFERSVKSIINIMDNMSANINDTISQQMAKAFALSCELEWHFWNDAYHEKKISKNDI